MLTYCKRRNQVSSATRVHVPCRLTNPYLPALLLPIQHPLHLPNKPLSLRPRRPEAIPTRIRIPRPRTPWDCLAALTRPRINRLGILPRARIDPDINRGIQSIRNRLPNEADLHNGVVATLSSHIEERVLGIERLGLRVGAVGRGFLDLGEEGLLDVELADVGDCAALDCVVGEELGAVVDDGWVC